jgi:hypothetical protein
MQLGRSSWQQEHVKEILHLMVDKKQREGKGLRTNHNLQKHVPSDLLPPGRPHLLKFSPPPKIMPPIGDQVFNT